MRVARAIFSGSILVGVSDGGERTQRFDFDPKWEEANNRVDGKQPVKVTQDFGYCASNFAGKRAGEMGGFVSRASEPAYYAARIGAKTLEDNLTASGTFALTQSSGGSG